MQEFPLAALAGPLADARGSDTGTLGSSIAIAIAIAITIVVTPARADEWTAVAPMASRRAFHTATVLADGRVLVAGGIPTYKGPDTANATAEVFDPATGAWTAVMPMYKERFEHCASVLADGRVLVAGGQDWTTNVVTAELFDPATGAWSAAASMFEPRYWCSATLLADGRVLVAGGLHNGEAIDTVEIYDPALDQWAEAPPMSISRAVHTATLLADGRVLVTGGQIKWDNTGARATAEIFDPEQGTWSPAGSMEDARSEHTATLLQDGRVLVAGGISKDGPTVFWTTAEIFDPKKGAWIEAGSMRGGRAGHVASILGNGRVLVAGGHDGDLVATAEIYDPAVDAWIDAPPMSLSRDYYAASLLQNGRVLVTGGSVAYTAPDLTRAEAEIFTPSTGTPCVAPIDCPTGSCVDGICCDSACDGPCDVCTKVAGATYDGACFALPKDDEGTCTRACLSAHDCPPPSVCDTRGRCVPPPPGVSDFSGCRASRSALPDALPWSLALVSCSAALAARRRRLPHRPRSS